MGSLYAHSLRRPSSKGLTTALLVLLTLVLPVCQVLAEDQAPDSKTPPLTKTEDGQTQKDGKTPLEGKKGPFEGLGGEDDTGGALQVMLLYSVIILVLGVGAVLVVKKLLPKIQRSAGKNLSIIETAYISPRSSVHLLRVGTKKYLISRSGDGISLLAEVTQALDGEESTLAPGE